MADSEFDLIRRHFATLGAPRADVLVGVGDDAALLAPQPGRLLVATVDTLVEGTHFLASDPARSVGHRALAVNLSDMAAMGAEPAWALLSLTMPAIVEAWIAQFASGFDALARVHGVQLVGGNTTSGALSVAVTVIGFVPPGQALLRDGARPGHALYVSGTPGDSVRGRLHPQASPGLRDRYLHPEPRVALGLALRGLASACIDVSDGLLGDARKLCEASGCGARIEARSLPLSEALLAAAGRDEAERCALEGGEDYELCFAVPPGHEAALLERVALDPGLGRVGRIGQLEETRGIVVTRGGVVTGFSQSGHDHFAR